MKQNNQNRMAKPAKRGRGRPTGTTLERPEAKPTATKPVEAKCCGCGKRTPVRVIRRNAEGRPIFACQHCRLHQFVAGWTA